MSTQHTPGPWMFDEPNGATVLHPRIYSDDGTVGAAHWVGWKAGDRLAETRANAAIMAAAPDMYEALKSIVEDHDFCGDDWGDRRDAWIETARAALAKVEGKS